MAQSNKLECGKMRHRIQIVQPSGVQDSFGGVTPADPSDWNVLLTCWAKIETPSARDVAAAGTFVSTISHKITIRDPRSQITGSINQSMQVWFKGRVFIIQGVWSPDETNKMFYLMCTEVAVNTPAAPNAATDR